MGDPIWRLSANSNVVGMSGECILAQKSTRVGGTVSEKVGKWGGGRGVWGREEKGARGEKNKRHNKKSGKGERKVKGKEH